ncbi:hypothetical protein [Bacillus norwichensis]|uniref:Uncharacterized protein n=1 Tax=Bacillus norwichensis TaxID=2762217 RepID=A0ABR8VT91_9BACI|nr:hypothetical protein [Bacillus norwichensis]MBD8007596.1 hypothetical protein [Bacillus norwichensis]
MSDVMKQVVQEVLQGNKTIMTNRMNQKNNTPANISLSEIKRPNYQQLKQEQRLSVLEESKMNKKAAVQKHPHGLSDKHFNEESISRLRSISMAQGKVSRKSAESARGNHKQARSAKIIGHTRNGGCVWFFPTLSQKLMGSFQRPLNRVAIGAVKIPECLPSYLLLVNEIIRDNQDIKFYISWERSGDVPFTAEFYDDDVDRLERVMNEIYQKLNRRALKQLESYTVMSPSPWLTKQLNISLSVDAIAILEGVPHYTSILLLDSLLKNFENTEIDYEIAEKYLLLKGNYHVISELVVELKKEAGRLTS